jgi:hypothetical protein
MHQGPISLRLRLDRVKVVVYSYDNLLMSTHELVEIGEVLDHCFLPCGWPRSARIGLKPIDGIARYPPIKSIIYFYDFHSLPVIYPILAA